MSQAHPEQHAHEGPIKSPKQLVLAVIFAFVVPVALILLLVTFVTSAERKGEGSDGFSEEAVAERIQPVGSIEIHDVNEVKALRTGEQVFNGQCAACHATGAAGAPKFGDTAAWGPRIGQGLDTLVQHALKGKNAMPPQGGGEYSDYEIARAVVYMANKGGAKFNEPPAPASAAGASGADAAAAPAAGTDAASSPAAAAAPQAAAPTATAAPSPAAPAPATATAAAPALYNQVCQACHAAGVAGAPKVGDKAAWAPRLAQGIDGLTANAIKGKNAMPPRGGSSASDADIKAVVTYMVNASK